MGIWKWKLLTILLGGALGAVLAFWPLMMRDIALVWIGSTVAVFAVALVHSSSASAAKREALRDVGFIFEAGESLEEGDSVAIGGDGRVYRLPSRATARVMS